MIYCSTVSFSTQDGLYFYQHHGQTNHVCITTIFCRMKSAVKFLVIILHCGRQPSASKKCFYTIFFNRFVSIIYRVYNRIHKRCVKMYKCNDCSPVFCLQYQCHEQAWYRRGGGSSDAACSSGQSLPAILAQNTG